MKAETKKSLVAVLGSPAWVCLIWFGMTAGVSMLATPARFTASTLTLPIALDVGRVVFAALNKAEFVALIILLIVVRVSGKAREFLLPTIVLALILIVQVSWLLPELAAGTDQIIAGAEPPPSMAHSVYLVLELTKLFLLAYLGFSSMQKLIRNPG